MKRMFTRWAVIAATCTLAAGTAGAADFSDCFVPGEKTEYKIYWMGIPIAWSTTTTETVTEDGRELIRITMIAKTYAAYSHIFEVDDRTEVVIDPETALPLRHDWVINEGPIHKSHLTTFNHASGKAVFMNRLNRDIREIPIKEDTREIFSFIYASRHADIKQLAAQKHELLVTGKLYELGLRIVGEDHIRVPDFGKVASLEIEPEAEFDGIFIRKGKISFWISQENPRMVTRIKASVAVGGITAKLQQVSGAADGFWNKKE